MKTSEITLKLRKKLSFAILDNFNFEVEMALLRLQFNCPFKCKKFQMGIQRHLELFKFELNYLYLLVDLFKMNWQQRHFMLQTKSSCQQ